MSIYYLLGLYQYILQIQFHSCDLWIRKPFHQNVLFIFTVCYFLLVHLDFLFKIFYSGLLEFLLIYSSASLPFIWSQFAQTGLNHLKADIKYFTSIQCLLVLQYISRIYVIWQLRNSEKLLFPCFFFFHNVSKYSTNSISRMVSSRLLRLNGEINQSKIYSTPLTTVVMTIKLLLRQKIDICFIFSQQTNIIYGVYNCFLWLTNKSVGIL